MKRKIYTIGETVYDIIFEHGEIKAGKAGGSMLNASVSLGRCGCDISFISEVGDDDPGKLILNFLKKNGVDISFVHSFSDGKTPLALAFLDENKNAKYSFYKAYPKQRLQQAFPQIRENDIVLFGSFFAINPEVRSRVLSFVRQAKNSGAIIVYDPNIRHPRNHNLKEVVNSVIENFSLADIVRASNEDFEALFDVNNPEDAAEILKDNSEAVLIYTNSSRYVFLASAKEYRYYSVPEINVLSTIGAGDNFNAGLIYGLTKSALLKKDLTNIDEASWNKLIVYGIQFSQQVCKSYENYIPVDFTKRMQLPKY